MQALYRNKEKYNEEKMRLATELLDRIEKKFPSHKGKIHILDVWIPVTYNRYCNTLYGAYMSFISTKTSKDTYFSENIKKLDNVVIASQWLMNPGGLPVAVMMEKFAVQRLFKKEKISIDL